MGRRSDHTREELTEMTISAAIELITALGPQGLTARRVADRIGYAPGTIYNLFEDLDDLLLRVNAHTLEALYDELSGPGLSPTPELALRQLAERFLHFVDANPQLWAAWLDGVSRIQPPLPEWYGRTVEKIFLLIDSVIRDYFPPDAEVDRRRHAHALWSAIYGISSLKDMNILPADENPHDLVDVLVSRIVSGLEVYKRQRSAANPAQNKVSGP